MKLCIHGEEQFSSESFSVCKRAAWYAKGVSNVYILEVCIGEKDLKTITLSIFLSCNWV